jgi:ATP-dependent Clp protease adaptor protein ClpS
VTTEAVPVVHPENEVRLEPDWHVVLWDDQDHSYEYVIEMLGKLFGYGLDRAFSMASEVDRSGRCRVWTGSLEKAEFKRDQIHGYGADWRIPRCRGSMSATLERAEA